MHVVPELKSKPGYYLYTYLTPYFGVYKDLLLYPHLFQKFTRQEPSLSVNWFARNSRTVVYRDLRVLDLGEQLSQTHLSINCRSHRICINELTVVHHQGLTLLNTLFPDSVLGTHLNLKI